ncbi:outer membrane protein [Propylenella binzhouense]|uniref:Porin family protein n=1 Tax=Propylenella binzhouense TaxID=2555902 RepID=A0A964T496_9HYPH|nr:outer membrane protein [Propylenella binzhouense]MYZ48054.1 porin family protein [Propylenella binzhouense]
MLRFTRIALAACASAAAMSAAMAADMPVYVPEVTPMPVPEVPVAVSGWYLRGDIGYKIYQDPNPKFNDPLTGPIGFSNNSIEDTGMVGAGIGYKFNNFLRADITADYEWPAKFKGNSDCACELATEYADISAFTTMVNAYIDLGYYAGFSPYVGAGIGASYVTADNGYGTVQKDGSITRYDYSGSSSKWNFAWALMAGVGYEFSPNLALDVGYRYLNLGSAESPVLQGLTSRIKYEDLSAHEIRVGLRYTIY